MSLDKQVLEEKLDQLAHINRSIFLLGEELFSVRAAAVTEHVAAMRRLADEEEARAMDKVKACHINADIDILQDRASMLEEQIKTDILLDFKASVKGQSIQAVYTPGRACWEDKMLLGYGAAHPEILGWRKIGQASVSLREIKGTCQ